MAFKLTYSTMFNPPAELHDGFERAPRQFAVASPIDTRIVLGRFQAGEDVHADAAAARNK